MAIDPERVKTLFLALGPSGLNVLRDSNGDWSSTTPTWPYHVDVLRSRVARPANHEVLGGVGSLPAVEEDLLDLLEELQRSLVPDFDPA